MMGLVKERDSSCSSMMGLVEWKMSKLDFPDGSNGVKWSYLDLHDCNDDWKMFKMYSELKKVKVQVGPP